MNKSLQNPKILFAIATCAKNKERQQILKETWIREVPDSIDWVFVEGREKDELDMENHMLYLDTEEGYIHLARKSYDLFSYAVRETDYDYVVKIDDDAFVDPENVVEFIRTQKPHYAGKKNVQPKSPKNIPYAQGGFYILSRKSLEVISEFPFEQGRGSLWWYGGQRGNKAWGVSDAIKETASIEDLMTGAILFENGIPLEPAFGSFDFERKWNEMRSGAFCIQLFLRICSQLVLSFHPATEEEMRKYYQISQAEKNRAEKRSGFFLWFAEVLARGLFYLGIVNTRLYAPIYISFKNKK